MSTDIKKASEDLRKASTRKSVSSKEVRSSIDKISSSLVLLDSYILSRPRTDRLKDVLRGIFAPLYDKLPIESLNLAATIYGYIFDNKVLKASRGGENAVRRSWELVLESLLSGILDHMEARDNSESKLLVSEKFRTMLCERHFPPLFEVSTATAPYMIAVYSVLAEIAYTDSHRKDLRDKIGGPMLGAVLAKSRDFLAIDALLGLFASLLPSVDDMSLGKRERENFVSNIFVESDVFLEGATLANLFLNDNVKVWEETTIQLYGHLAKCSLEYPQPYQVYTLTIYGQPISRISTLSRLFLDQHALVMNMIEDDFVDSLQIEYSQIQRISASVFEDLIMFSLHFLPPYPCLVSGIVQPFADAESAVMEFCLSPQDVPSFLQVTDDRGFKGMALPIQPSHLITRVSVPNSTTPLDFDIDNMKTIPLASQRASMLRDIYEAPLTETSPKIADMVKSGSKNSRGDSTPSKRGAIAARTEDEPAVEQPQELNPDSSQISSASSISMDSSDPIYRAVFGETDEELSEISDAESLPRLVGRKKSKKGSKRASKVGKTNHHPSEDAKCIVKKKSSSKSKISRKLITEGSVEMAPRRSPRLKEKHSRRQQEKNKPARSPFSEAGDTDCKMLDVVSKNEANGASSISPNVHDPPGIMTSSEDFFVAPRVDFHHPGQRVQSPSTLLKPSQHPRNYADGSSNESEFTTPTRSKPTRSYAKEVLAGVNQKRKQPVPDDKNVIPENGAPAKKRYKPNILATFASYLPGSTYSPKTGKKRSNQNSTPSVVISTSKTLKPLDANDSRNHNLPIHTSPRTNNIAVKDQLALVESRNSLKNSFAQRSSSIDADHVYKKALSATLSRRPTSTTSRSKSLVPIVESASSPIIDRITRASYENVSSMQVDEDHYQMDAENVPPSKNQIVQFNTLDSEKNTYIVVSPSSVKKKLTAYVPNLANSGSSPFRAPSISGPAGSTLSRKLSSDQQKTPTYLDGSNSEPPSSIRRSTRFTGLSQLTQRVSASNVAHFQQLGRNQSEAKSSSDPLVVSDSKSLRLDSSEHAATSTRQEKPPLLLESKATTSNGVTREIENVVTEICGLVVRNLQERFGIMEKQSRIDAKHTLEEASSHLRTMYTESVEHYNQLRNFQEEYADYGQKLLKSYQKVLKVNREIATQVEHILEECDHASLSRRMPRTLFPGPIPAELDVV